MRYVIHNHMTTRSVGRFRSTAGAHDHGPGGCSCGGKCSDCKDRLRLHRDRASQYTTADLSIDVTYEKGPMGKKLRETRHYTVPGFMVDPRGHAPNPTAVAAELRKLPEHKAMVDTGWRAERAEGYYKKEQRDVGGAI